jgi:hypothetical protein
MPGPTPGDFSVHFAGIYGALALGDDLRPVFVDYVGQMRAAMRMRLAR